MLAFAKEVYKFCPDYPGGYRTNGQVVIVLAAITISEGEPMFGLFKSKPKPGASLPSAEAEPGRYKGRPLLILIENYVLACIGELPPDSNIAAVVQKAFGGGDDWMQTLREKLDLSAAIDESIREMWSKNQAIAKEQKVQLHPVQFAKMVADRNFAGRI